MSDSAVTSPLVADLTAAVAAAVGPALPGASGALDTAGAGPAADDVIVEEEATLEAVRTKGLLSCARCGLRLRHGEHVPRLLPACLHTLCPTCAPPQNGKILHGLPAYAPLRRVGKAVYYYDTDWIG